MGRPPSLNLRGSIIAYYKYWLEQVLSTDTAHMCPRYLAIRAEWQHPERVTVADIAPHPLPVAGGVLNSKPSQAEQRHVSSI
eukprot:COSAG06_NODE_6650_length_2840_cov_2.929588_6_plen_82_part_00